MTIIENVQRYFEGIIELMRRKRKAEQMGDTDLFDSLCIEIKESAYGIAYADSWIKADKLAGEKIYILLAAGNPAVRILALLNQYGRVSSARLQYRDWFDPWEEYLEISQEERELLREYADHYFVE